PGLSLALLVLRVGANHAHHPAPVNHLALVANLFYRCPNFHFPLLAKTTYLYRYTMRPRVRSYGESSTATLSPARMRMKFLRIFPEMCASTRGLFSSSTRNIALGSGSMTVAITSMASSFGLDASALRLSASGRLPICPLAPPTKMVPAFREGASKPMARSRSPPRCAQSGLTWCRRSSQLSNHRPAPSPRVRRCSPSARLQKPCLPEVAGRALARPSSAHWAPRGCAYRFRGRTDHAQPSIHFCARPSPARPPKYPRADCPLVPCQSPDPELPVSPAKAS